MALWSAFGDGASGTPARPLFGLSQGPQLLGGIHRGKPGFPKNVPEKSGYLE